MSFTYFIADIHLSDDRPDITQCLLNFLAQDAIHADALYVLGDLFEVWIGDDNITDLNETVAKAFNAVSQKTPVYFIHGNRDFALGKKWAAKAGMTLLPEQAIIDLYGTKTLISHGDELCTRDIAYQKFRKKSRSWWWLPMMLALPLSLRQKMATKGRKKSKANQENLTMEIMDVTQDEVVKTMEAYDVHVFIHGHTHRPNIHTLTVHGKTARRIVLGDWYTQGSVLRVSANDIQLEQRSFSAQKTS